MIDRQEIIDRNPLVPFMEGRGIALRGQGKTLTTNRCAGHEHKQGHFCVDVDTERQIWRCHDCETGGSVIDFCALAFGIEIGEAMKRLGGEDTPAPSRRATAPAAPQAEGKAKMVKTYAYTDEAGKLLFEVCRYEPKDFRQRAPDGAGGHVYKLDGVRRVLYNLPKVLKSDCVFLCEGEKDADTLTSINLTATTNCGGSKKWDATYTATLRGKDVVILPDNDKAGADHRDLLKQTLSAAVKSIRVVEMPEGVKDVTEFSATFQSLREFGQEILNMADAAEVLYRGESVPVQTMEELEQDYKVHIKQAATHSFSIGDWLPALKYPVRPLVPGELVTVLAGTGVGKTMILQNIALHTRLSTLLFEAELPGTLSFERFAAMATDRSGRSVSDSYRVGADVEWRKAGRLNHIACCHKSSITTADVKRIILNAELKTCMRPVLVLIDYIQLIQGVGDSRYERTSCVAEQLKVVAKETGTIIIIASQVGRPQSERGKKEDGPREVCLTDGKDSGSIENSSGLVLGAWREKMPQGELARIVVRVLKNTKGIAGDTVACRISDSLLIHQEENQPQ